MYSVLRCPLPDLQEVNILRSLDHPAIARVLDIFEDDPESEA